MPRSSTAPAAESATALAHHEVIIVGAGFAGLGAAIQLRAQGIDLLVLEKAAAIGGVWRDNNYPGCGCDIPSALYSYSFAPNPHWSRWFATQAEIKQYTEDTARRFGVLPLVRLQTELRMARWLVDKKHWQLETSAGTYTAKFVVMACGPMHTPIVPDIPGLDTFTGTRFHSAQWNHAYDLTQQRVAVIGSGASAIQFVPKIHTQVKRLSLFQRTAPWVLPKMDAAISPRWQTIFKRFPGVQSGLRWLLYQQFELLNASLKYPALLKRLQGVGLRHIHRSIQDPALKAQVTPDFSIGCKRILMSNTWYRALAHKQVAVLPGVARIQGQTVVASNGASAEVDALIFATGFEVANPPIAQHIVGASGQLLSTQWQGSPQAYFGTMTPDCPNLFLTFGPNLYSFTSAFVILEAQLKFIGSAVLTARKKSLATIAVDPVKSARYNLLLQQSLQRSVWNSGCSSYFIDKNGRNSTNWPWTTYYMRWRLARFNANDYLTESNP